MNSPRESDGELSYVLSQELGHDQNSLRTRLAKIERTRKENRTRPLNWQTRSWPRELRTGPGIRRKGSLVELVYKTRELNVTVTFERIVPESGNESDRRRDAVASDESLRVPLTIEGGEWISLPSGQWMVSVDCAETPGESRRYANGKVKLERGQAYLLEFGEREEREALHLIGESPRRSARPGPTRGSAREPRRFSNPRVDPPLGSGSAPRREPSR